MGSVNYFADIRCLDLFGLCDREIAGLKRQRAYDTAALERRAAAARVQVAAVYDSRFGGDYGPPLPAGWARVGVWRISDNSFLGGDTVSFYAVEPREAARLARCLREFSSHLPAEVAHRALL